MKKILLATFLFLTIFLTSGVVFAPTQGPKVKMIIGSIVDPDHVLSQEQDLLRDYLLRYNGYSCGTDQNGLCFFKCDEMPNPQSLSDPVFILIGNGNYWSDVEDVVGGRIFRRPVLKQLPEKKHLFFKSRIDSGRLFFDKIPISSHCEIPYERTLIFNVNPDYVEDEILPIKNYFYNDGHLRLPDIRLKKGAVIKLVKDEKQRNSCRECKKNTPSLVKRRLKDKSMLRKFKHEDKFGKTVITIGVTSPKCSSKKNNKICLRSKISEFRVS